MFKRLRQYWRGTVHDRYSHHHKPHCPMYGHLITVICNSQGKKYSDCLIKYCPFCGEELKQ